MMEKLAGRMGRLGTETAFDVLVKAKALEARGRSVVHLELGEPDFDTPPNVIGAANAAMVEGYTHYCASAGLAELREAIADHVGQTRSVPIGPDWVVVTPGAKPIMFFLILALVEEGDEVIFPDPGFPIYESMIRFCGGTPVPLPLLEEFEFRFDPRQLQSKVSSRTKLMIVNSPQNPTGGLLTENDLEIIADLATRHDITVLSDEIYSSIIYEGAHRSIASIPGMMDRTVILDGFSKTFAMTGWRLGYGIMRPELQTQISKLVTNSVSCTAPFSQRAGLEALAHTGSAVVRMVAEFRKRREFLVEALNRIPGVGCLKPPGAFYVFPNIRSFGKPSDQIADYLLQEAGVALLSGTAFGASGEGYLRLSYATSIENLAEGSQRIAAGLARL
jgi:aspartate aminotransferase